MASTVEIEGIPQLERLLISDPKMETRIRALIRKVIKNARNQLAASARSGLGMKSDPRGAAQSIRRSVYKAVLGGQVNILSSRRAGRRTSYEPQRTLQPGQRGGNRVPRGRRTQDMMSYGPHDRSMVLRWLSNGTDDREAGTRGGRLHGNRGRIAARGWFGRASEQSLQKASEELVKLIDEEIQKVMQ